MGRVIGSWLRLAPVVLITAFAPIPAHADASATDKAAISAVVEAFRLGIIAKDRAALERLPVNPSISFMSALEPETLGRWRARHPEATRLSPSSYPAFVDEIVTSMDRQEETFSDIRIDSDGTVATVYFSYQFKENDVVSNWGHETWGLIATDGGWKISSIIWSVAVPAPAQAQ